MTTRMKDPQEARVDEFGAKVRASVERIARIGADSGRSEAERLNAALELLREQNAELSTAEEELRVQVDELAQALGALQVERERFREVFEATPEAYFVTDALGVIREVNARACALLEHDPRFLRGKPLAVYLEPDDTKELRNALGQIGKEPIDLAVRLVSRTHKRVATHLRGVPHDGGRRILWIAREATPETDPSTDAHALARALRDKEELLARERQRSETLDREARSKDRFLAVLSHDLRSPLNAVIGWTELLRREFLDQGRRDRALATIERNARSMLGLVEELLDISRITTDKMQLDVRPLELGALAKRVVEATHPVAAEKGVVLSATVEDDVGVVGDAKRLEQVLHNLLSNAIEFTPSGGRVQVSVKRDGESAKLIVSDTGAGISPTDLQHLFEVFKQGESRSSKGGLGLGLYIVRQIMLLHGGDVSATSEGEGKGTTVTCELPLGQTVPAAASSTHLPLGDLSGDRVLVIDDEEDARELMTTLLANAGAHVASVATVGEAVELMRTWRPDAAVVSDLGLPTGDGLAIAKEARAQLGADVVVVAVSGHTADRDVASTLDAGFDAHLAKPLAAGELVAALLRARSVRSR